MMQEPEVIEKLKKSYRFVDLVFGTHNIYKFAELLTTAMESDRTVFDIWKDTDKIVEDLPAEPYLSIQIRCQHHVRLQQLLQLLHRSLRARSGSEAADRKISIKEIQ